ncbi:MAG: hypothetical protein N3A38_12665, partial [Planctomycetota bacterium]|nr:hypothetical protein [Planctomycetota bacterium]
GTGSGDATAPRREGRPVVSFEEEGADGEDASATGSAGKLLVYRRAVPASYFQNLAQAALRHNLRYPVTRRFAWTFRLKLPGRPVPERTNGEIGPDGTITWRFDLGDMMKDGADMRAACTAPCPARLLPAVMPWLVAFLVFSGMVLTAGLYGLKRCLDRERDTGTPPDFEV